jgi:hypothetical protein
LRPLFEVLYEELLAQREQAQAQRRTELLKAFLPFLRAYKTVLTTYPPALLTASAPEVAAQLDTPVELRSCNLTSRLRTSNVRLTKSKPLWPIYGMILWPQRC